MQKENKFDDIAEKLTNLILKKVSVNHNGIVFGETLDDSIFFWEEDIQGTIDQLNEYLLAVKEYKEEKSWKKAYPKYELKYREISKNEIEIVNPVNDTKVTVDLESFNLHFAPVVSKEDLTQIAKLKYEN